MCHALARVRDQQLTLSLGQCRHHRYDDLVQWFGGIELGLQSTDIHAAGAKVGDGQDRLADVAA